jgi:hypothetical protein
MYRPALFFAALVAVVLVSLACATAPRPASIAAASSDVLALIADYDRALNAKDRARLNELLDPSYIYFTSKGAVWSRDRVLGMVLSPDYHLSSATRGELAVHGDGVTATVSSRWTGAGTFKEHAFTDDQRCGLTVTRRADRLVVLAEYCTQIVP